MRSITPAEANERRLGDAAALGVFLNPKCSISEPLWTFEPATPTKHRQRVEPNPTNAMKKVLHTLERMTES